MEKKNCKICKSLVFGREDKIFCSTRCKNLYHINLRQVTRKNSLTLDRHLHRNWSIILEILGSNSQKAIVPRILMAEKKFLFKYITHYHKSEQGHLVHYVYDMGWVELPNDEVMLFRTDFSMRLRA